MEREKHLEALRITDTNRAYIVFADAEDMAAIHYPEDVQCFKVLHLSELRLLPGFEPGYYNIIAIGDRGIIPPRFMDKDPKKYVCLAVPRDEHRRILPKVLPDITWTVPEVTTSVEYNSLKELIAAHIDLNADDKLKETNEVYLIVKDIVKVDFSDEPFDKFTVLGIYRHMMKSYGKIPEISMLNSALIMAGMKEYGLEANDEVPRAVFSSTMQKANDPANGFGVSVSELKRGLIAGRHRHDWAELYNQTKPQSTIRPVIELPLVQKSDLTPKSSAISAPLVRVAIEDLEYSPGNLGELERVYVETYKGIPTISRMDIIEDVIAKLAEKDIHFQVTTVQSFSTFLRKKHRALGIPLTPTLSTAAHKGGATKQAHEFKIGGKSAETVLKLLKEFFPKGVPDTVRDLSGARKFLSDNEAYIANWAISHALAILRNSPPWWKTDQVK